MNFSNTNVLKDYYDCIMRCHSPTGVKNVPVVRARLLCSAFFANILFKYQIPLAGSGSGSGSCTSQKRHAELDLEMVLRKKHKREDGVATFSTASLEVDCKSDSEIESTSNGNLACVDVQVPSTYAAQFWIDMIMALDDDRPESESKIDIPVEEVVSIMLLADQWMVPKRLQRIVTYCVDQPWTVDKDKESSVLAPLTLPLLDSDYIFPLPTLFHQLYSTSCVMELETLVRKYPSLCTYVPKAMSLIISYLKKQWIPVSTMMQMCFGFFACLGPLETESRKALWVKALRELDVSGWTLKSLVAMNILFKDDTLFPLHEWMAKCGIHGTVHSHYFFMANVDSALIAKDGKQEFESWCFHTKVRVSVKQLPNRVLVAVMSETPSFAMPANSIRVLSEGKEIEGMIVLHQRKDTIYEGHSNSFLQNFVISDYSHLQIQARFKIFL